MGAGAGDLSQKDAISLNFSLFTGICGGERFAEDSVLRHKIFSIESTRLKSLLPALLSESREIDGARANSITS